MRILFVETGICDFCIDNDKKEIVIVIPQETGCECLSTSYHICKECTIKIMNSFKEND